MADQKQSNLGLPRACRLVETREFAHIKEQGQRLVAGCLALNWITLPLGSKGKLGVIASRRIGGSVVRCRAKRLMREVYRLNKARIIGSVAVVLIARSSITKKDMRSVEKDFLRSLRLAGLLLEPL